MKIINKIGKFEKNLKKIGKLEIKSENCKNNWKFVKLYLSLLSAFFKYIVNINQLFNFI